jgi:hypothetical protein
MRAVIDQAGNERDGGAQERRDEQPRRGVIYSRGAVG